MLYINQITNNQFEERTLGGQVYHTLSSIINGTFVKSRQTDEIYTKLIELHDNIDDIELMRDGKIVLEIFNMNSTEAYLISTTPIIIRRQSMFINEFIVDEEDEFDDE